MEQNIKIKIGGSEYSLRAASEEMEQLMRLAAEAINKQLSTYDARFPDKTLSDKLAFVSLNEAIIRMKYQRMRAACDNESKKLQNVVEDYLKNIEKNGR